MKNLFLASILFFSSICVYSQNDKPKEEKKWYDNIQKGNLMRIQAQINF